MLDALSNVKAALLRSNLSGIFTRPATDTGRPLLSFSDSNHCYHCVWLGRVGRLHFRSMTLNITMHNAQVVLSGEDRNFSGVPALVGAASIIHLAFVTGLMLVLPPEPASFTVNAFAVLFYALGLARLAFCLGATPAVAALAVWVGTLSGYGLFHLFNGLETGLAMAVGVWALVFALSPLRRGSCPAVRPDAVCPTGTCRALSPADVRQTWSTGHKPVPISPTFTAVVRDGVLAILAAAPWLVWSWLDTGHLLPPPSRLRVRASPWVACLGGESSGSWRRL